MTAVEPVLKAVAPDARRQHKRYLLEAPGMAATTEGVFDCTVADISVGGAMLEGDLPLPVGTEVALAFDSLLGILGEVVHHGDGFIGLRFAGDEAQRRVIVQWVRRRLRGARLTEIE